MGLKAGDLVCDATMEKPSVGVVASVRDGHVIVVYNYNRLSPIDITYDQEGADKFLVKVKRESRPGPNRES